MSRRRTACSRRWLLGVVSAAAIGLAGVGAAQDRPNFQLQVVRSGPGGGSVRSLPRGIDCGQDCTAPFPRGTAVQLIATPEPGSRFVEWRGACTGIGTGGCVVTLDQGRQVTAVFFLSD